MLGFLGVCFVSFVHPIDFRYGSEMMRGVFSQENKLELMLRVEGALAEAHAEFSEIPKALMKVIVEKASTKFVKLERVEEIEKEIQHDVMAMVIALSEQCGESGKYVHLGATSYDIVDTVLALQLKEALAIIRNEMILLLRIVTDLADTHRRTLCVGRTHGVHAEPYIFGHKFAVWADEIIRHIERLDACKEKVCVGKMTGAVGTQAAFGINAEKLQDFVMKNLGIKSAEISTQIVSRDRIGELICLLALISSSMDKFATEIRNLQRTEIGEVEEPFREEAQVGSSAMPHKRNPWKSERVSGLARILRGLVIPALENVITWHERDLANSSSERCMIPEIFMLLEEQFRTFTKVLEGLKISKENLKKNLKLTKGLIMSEALMILLTRKGMGRQEAHELVRKIAIKSVKEGQSFEKLVLEESEITALCTLEELKKALKPKNFIGTAPKQVLRIVRKARKILKKEEVL